MNQPFAHSFTIYNFIIIRCLQKKWELTSNKKWELTSLPFFFVNIILFQLQFAIPFATSEKSTSIVGKSAISSITTEAWDFFFGDPGELGPTVGD